ncbi:hypothetical protein [Actinokineospora sp. HUAS TT18]|uniref:hypothetical protein n=1 Tax=Actinokineospora sp. HUAS TT18 TaxID=3447451 RepID=UPI003F5252DF
MLILIVILLVLWLITAVVGFAFEGLMWLAIVGIVLFVGTAVIGFVRRATLRR